MITQSTFPLVRFSCLFADTIYTNYYTIEIYGFLQWQTPVRIQTMKKHPKRRTDASKR